MATTHPPTISHDLVEHCETFLKNYYIDAIASLAQAYPTERSLTISFEDLRQFDADLADDALSSPDDTLFALKEALLGIEIPVDIGLSRAHVRLTDLPETQTYYPGGFSPSEHRGNLRGIIGEISKATEVYSTMQTAAFKCQRCGTMTEVPQPETGWQEPHQCQGCERQGPFQIAYDQSTFVDAQKIRLQEPPEEAQGEGESIDIFLEDDLAGRVETGDRVTVSGVIQLEQQGGKTQKKNKFEPYVDGLAISVDEADIDDVDITPDRRERIQALANGAEGDPLDLASSVIAPKIYGFSEVKKAILLALVGGSRVEYEAGDADRGEFHILLIGDPSTAKSKLVDFAELIGWRSVGVSGRGATVAGVTASAIQDDFGDGSWSLEAGAAVKAHHGVLCIDELDDMPAEVRSALLEPMSKQSIHVTKGGINTHLQTQCAFIAACNPVNGRFDPYSPIPDQFEFSSTLLSRFDLVFTFTDHPDEERDEKVASHILDTRDAGKRPDRDATPAEDGDVPIDGETLRAWIALAKQQSNPHFATEAVREKILETFTDLRGMYGYDDPDDPVPVTFRSLEGIVRVAEAAAKFEFSSTITERHVSIASSLVGKSMQDIGKDPDTGSLDADIVEIGRSQSQANRKERIEQTIKDLQRESDDDQAAIDDVVARLEDDWEPSQIRHEIDQFHEEGILVKPDRETVRWIGRY